MTKKFFLTKILAYKKKEQKMTKIYGERVLKKVGVKATGNYDIDHLLITENNIYAISVTGKKYWNIKSEGLTKEDIEIRYGVNLSR